MPKTQFVSNQQHRISPKRILGAILALLAFCLLLMSVINLAKKYFAVRQRNEELQEESLALQQKDADLQTTNEYLSSPAGVEQSLRERYNYVKPGEGMIIITPSPDADDTAAQPHSALARWWDNLFH